MGAPACGAGDGKEGGVHLGGDAQHTVDQTRVEIHVGAHFLVQTLVGAEQIGGQTLDGLQQIEVIPKALLVGLLAGKLLEQHGAGIRLGIHRVTHTVDETASVSRFLVEDLEEEGGQLVVVSGVLDVFLDAVEHLHHLEVGTAVTGALQRADASRDGGVGVGARGGQDAGGEGGAVTAAVLGVDDQAEIQEVRLGLGVFLVRAEDAEEVLGGTEVIVGVMESQGLIEEGVAVDRVGLGGDNGEAGHDLNGLAEHIVQRHLVGVIVIGIESQHRALELVHDGAGGGLHDDVLGKARRQTAQGGQEIIELRQLLSGGEVAEEEEEGGLLKAKAVLVGEVVDEIPQVVAAVLQHTLYGVLIALADHVTVGGADTGNTRHDAGAVGLAETSLDTVAVKGGAGNGICGAGGAQEGIEFLLGSLVHFLIFINVRVVIEWHNGPPWVNAFFPRTVPRRDNVYSIPHF